MENSILYRCNRCNAELVGGVTGDNAHSVKAPTAIGCLICPGRMAPVGELTPEQVETWRSEDRDHNRPSGE